MAVLSTGEVVRSGLSPLLQVTVGLGTPSAEQVIVMYEPERTVTEPPTVACTETIPESITMFSSEELMSGG